MSEQIPNIILQYGLAGVVIYIFYKLFSNELRELRTSINELQKSIDELILYIKALKEK